MARLGTIALWVMAGLVLLVLLRLVSLSLLTQPPDTLGVAEGRLAPCPEKPNCVSSQAERPSHSIEPLVVEGSEAEAVAAARAAIASMRRARIVTTDGGYLHAEYTSRLFRFVDDLELLYDLGLPGFQVRSASRVGTSDLGVNRKRVEELRALLAE